MKKTFPMAALNTLGAPWWRLWLAELLGKKEVYPSLDGTVTVCKWRGILYVVDYTPAKEQAQ